MLGSAESRDGDSEEEPENTGLPEPAAIEVRWPLHILKAERTIFELHRQWKLGVLKLNPEFQRDFVWTREKQIELVESVLAKVPLPVFYLSEENEEEILVVDGQQRLTTLFSFIDGYFVDNGGPPLFRSRFVLKGMKLTPEFNDCACEAFPGEHMVRALDIKVRRRFEATPLTCFVIQPGTSESVKFEVFRRLNQGAATLNPQEIRNALNAGPGLDLVTTLASQGGLFRQVAGGERRKFGPRKRADELVLRALAFLWRPWQQEYRGDLQRFLNDALTKLNMAPQADRDALEGRFLHALDIIQAVFDKHAFERFDVERNMWAGHLSGPLVETLVSVIALEFPAEKPTEIVSTRIRELFQTACGEPAFENAILTATQTLKNVTLRMARVTELVRAAKSDN